MIANPLLQYNAGFLLTLMKKIPHRRKADFTPSEKVSQINQIAIY